jgi:hypothetical protein
MFMGLLFVAVVITPNNEECEAHQSRFFLLQIAYTLKDATALPAPFAYAPVLAVASFMAHACHLSISGK